MRARDPIVIAVAQPACVGYDVELNAAAHSATVRSAGARLVIFPELSLTGYELDAPAVAPRDPRLLPIVEACAEVGAAALVGAPVTGGDGDTHIGMLVVDGHGVEVAYRKIWLGGAEPERFTAGLKPAFLEVGGWRLGLAICRDIGVPQHAADTAALGIDAYVAGTCESVAAGTRQDERARRTAADHGVWVAVASFAGATGGGFDRTAGRSAIWNPAGALVTQAGPEPGTYVRATLADRVNRVAGPRLADGPAESAQVSAGPPIGEGVTSSTSAARRRVPPAQWPRPPGR